MDIIVNQPITVQSVQVSVVGRESNFKTSNITGLQIRESDGKLNPLFYLQTLCCGYSLELSQRDNSN